MNNSKSTFHLPWRRRITLFIIVMWLPIMITFNELLTYFAVIMLVNIAIPIFGMWHIFMVTIDSEGVVLNRVNKLLWSDVVNARKVKALGLNHIRVKRKKGKPWLVPLFFIGKESIEAALLKNAPEGNPLHTLASELINREH